MSVWRRTRSAVVRLFADTAPGSRAGFSREPGSIGVTVAALSAGGRYLYRCSRRAWERCQAFRRENELARRDFEQVRKDARRSERRALVLLVRQLNHEQREEFRRYGYFHVTGGNTGDRYRIRSDRAANIEVLHAGGKAKYRLCAGPVGVPVHAMMAGQLLHLQDPASEKRFLRLANIHPAYPTLSGNIP